MKVRNIISITLAKEEDSGHEGDHHTDADRSLLMLANILKLMEECVKDKVGFPGIDEEDGNKQRGKVVDNTKKEVGR